MTRPTAPLLSGIDYRKYAAERAAHFTGREWVFSALQNWLEDPHSSRFFVLTGEPGSGKSAISAQLYRFALGEVPPPPGFKRLGKGFLDGAHFCSARDGYWIDPRRFATSLSLQLAAGYPAFARALVEQSADRSIRINASNHVNHSSGTVIGVQIHHLDVGASRPVDAFNRVVRDPLETLFRARPETRLTILMDSLDEALVYAGEASIASLLLIAEGLPPGVRFVVSSRPGNEALHSLRDLDPPTVELSLSAGDGSARSRDDIRTYVWSALAQRPRLKLNDRLTPEDFVGAVEVRSEGNFLYVRYLLEMFERQTEPVGLDSLKELPTSLNGIYREFLKRLGSPESEAWERTYTRLLGTLAVAREPLGEHQLGAIVGLEVDELARALRPLQQILDPDDRFPNGEGKYALYHRSFADFLLDRDRAQGYWCMAVRQHERVARWYLNVKPSRWPDDASHYGLRHLVSHLTLTIVGWDNAHPDDPAGRSSLIQELAGLVTDSGFQDLHLGVLDDPSALRSDLEAALDTVAQFVGQDDHQGLLPLVRSALGLVQFNQERLRPEPIFEAAREGRLEEAETRLALFAPEAHWRQAILLVLAWLAMNNAPDRARALRDKVTQNLLDDAPLPLLLARVNADLAQPPLPAPDLPPLPPAPPELKIQALVQRLEGIDVNPVMTRLHLRHSQDDLWVDRLQEDGANLVATALENPGEGELLLRQYLARQASDVYEQYRNLSLWVLLRWVLCHPDQDWARHWTTELARAALAGGGPQFQEALGLTTLGFQARAGVREAKTRLEELESDSAVAAMSARFDPGDSGSRRQVDSWGHLRRRLAVLAEVHTRLDGELAPDLTNNKGKRMLAHALDYLGGFAGFRAPALMALAGTARVVDPGDVLSVDQALDQALWAAHNIQDGHFCAITTARVNAMRQRWFPGPSDWPQSLKRFLADPRAPEFASLHVVGEAYRQRNHVPYNLELNREVRDAVSLSELARLYQRASLTQAFSRPIDEFRRLNPSWDADEPLPEGTEVNVPDPGFAVLLADRFSAEILVVPLLKDSERANLIARLVPFAVPNPTAVDAVLSRLLLVARPDDQAQLDELAQLAALEDRMIQS